MYNSLELNIAYVAAKVLEILIYVNSIPDFLTWLFVYTSINYNSRLLFLVVSTIILSLQQLLTFPYLDTLIIVVSKYLFDFLKFFSMFT